MRMSNLMLVGVFASLSVPAGATSALEQARGVVYHDRNANGVRDAGEPGLAGVGVSNQREVVRTDEQGRWTLPVDEDDILFVIKPRNWMTAIDKERMLPRFYYIHKPAGSPKLKFAGVEPTGPLPESIEFPLYPQPEPDKFQAVFFGDTQPRNVTEVNYMVREVIPELVGTPASFGVTLGDVVFDDLSVFEPHNQAVALIGIPWYNVLGNHDQNYDVPDDVLADETFERHFGPNYYAFNHGPVHFIVLDNVVWTGPTGEEQRGKYHSGLQADQIKFIKNDLAHVPREQLIMMMMHIPITETQDREELFRLIEDRPYTMSVSAHRHYQEHRYLGTDEGWRGAEPHHHVVNVTVCGGWWQGEPNELGIPHALMTDGGPNGYSIFTFDGHRATITYKAASHPADYQMNIYAPDLVLAGQAGQTEVVVNVFAGSERSKVEMRLGEQGAWRAMERVDREDPNFARLKELENIEGRKLLGRPMNRPTVSKHIWQAMLPSDAPPGEQWVEVRTVDQYGQSYTARRAIVIQ